MQDESQEKPSQSIQRIVILGTSGSGKSTLAKQLAERIAAPHIELDSLHHGPNWTPVPLEQFQASLVEQTSGETWIVDGNYIDKTSEILWKRADTIIWLDIPLRVILPRIFKRSIARIVNKTELWAGNREQLSVLVGKESLLTWAISSQRRHRKELPMRLSPPELTGISVLRFRSSDEVARWLAGWSL